jgi:putative transposase
MMIRVLELCATGSTARVIRTPVRAPRANAYAERWVRTVREECLDWLLVRNEAHLEAILADYVDHYNQARPHRGIQLEVPTGSLGGDQTSHPLAEVVRIYRLGGLVPEYRRAA